MAIVFSEILGLGVPVTIAGIASNRLLAIWWGLGAWMWSQSSDEGKSWSTPAILTNLHPADSSDRSDSLFLRSVAMATDQDTVYFAFRHRDVLVEEEDGASPLVRVGKGEFSGGSWVFTLGDSVRIGADNRRGSNHRLLPEIGFDAANQLVHLLTARERDAFVADEQRWRLDAFDPATLTSSYSSTRDETIGTSGRIGSLALGVEFNGGKLGVAMALVDGTVRAYPEIVAAGASYSTFPGTSTDLSGGSALENTERPIVACDWIDLEDLAVFALGPATMLHWAWNGDGSPATWSSASSVGTVDTMETLDAGFSVEGFVFAQAAGFQEPRLRVNDDALIDPDIVEMPPGAELPFRAMSRTVRPATLGIFKQSNLVAISDLVSGRVYFVDWRAVPLQPIDLEPEDGAHVGDGLITLRARYRMQEELTGKLVFEIDDDENFGSIDQTHEATLLADDQMGEITTTALDEGTWFWRVRGNVDARGNGVDSETRSFVVGATTSNCRPEDGKAIASTGGSTDVEFCCQINTISGVTAHVEVEADTVETFDSVNKKSGSGPNVGDGLDSCVTLNDFTDGVWFWRSRAVTAGGTAGPWSDPRGFRIGTSGDPGGGRPIRRMTAPPTVSERGQDRVNRVIVKVRNSAVEVIRETDPPPAANRRREKVIWIETGDEAIAAQVAADYLEAHSTTRKTVDGIVVPLTPDLVLDRKVRLSGVQDLSEEAYAPVRVEHDLAAFTTKVTAGDYSPTIEQALARLADRLERTRSEEKS